MRQCGWLVALVLAGVARPIWATSGFTVQSENDPLTCLTRPADAPAYPPSMLERKGEAYVRVRMTFEAPDRAPKVDLFYNSGQDDFEAPVRAHVRAYRLPCMTVGAGPVVATQEFRFTPGDGRKVFWSPERREDDDRQAMTKCISFGKGKPSYPLSARYAARPPVGTVLAKMRFTAVNEPPEVAILFNGGTPMLAGMVSGHIGEQYRMTCEPPSGFPVVASQSFSFTFEGEREFRFKDVDLKTFVGGLRDVERQPVVFDFKTMGCPFELQLRVYQPYQANSVGEVGSSDPNRREFIEWVKNATFKLPPASANQLVGGSMKVSVPCGQLDLS